MAAYSVESLAEKKAVWKDWKKADYLAAPLALSSAELSVAQKVACSADSKAVQSVGQKAVSSVARSDPHSVAKLAAMTADYLAGRKVGLSDQMRAASMAVLMAAQLVENSAVRKVD